MNEIKIVTAIVIGCGNRGEVYSTYALKHPDRFKIVGIAESKEHVRAKFIERYSQTIDKNKVFSDWKEIFTNIKLADCVIITLPDKLHKEASIEALRQGYHILLEKPMATSLSECKEIAFECEKHPELINAVCHVLRYYDACVKLKQIIDSGLIGQVVNINHTEPVGFWHFAHSFVRGNWRNESLSTFSLLAKCCHDIDLLVYWMGSKKRCVKVTSFGSLVHFRKENAPESSTKNCFSCPVEESCSYSAKKIYLDQPNIDPHSWPWSVVLDTDIFALTNSKVGDIEDILKGKIDSEKNDLIKSCLSHEDSKYGRCVYKCDNDVCDNQVVVMNFDDNSIATLTMIAYSKNTCTRQTKIYGTKGELEWDDAISSTNIIHTDFLTRQKQVIDAKADTMFTHFPKSALELNKNLAKLSGHGGNYFFIVDEIK
jgi:predicted dehydrogenase